jgi:hypothetical protein
VKIIFFNDPYIMLTFEPKISKVDIWNLLKISRFKHNE